MKSVSQDDAHSTALIELNESAPVRAKARDLGYNFAAALLLAILVHEQSNDQVGHSLMLVVDGSLRRVRGSVWLSAANQIIPI